MKFLAITLAADGTSDRLLIPIIKWILKNENVALREIGFVSNSNLSTRILESLSDEPFDILLVHRDAENDTYEKRLAEINTVVHQSEFNRFKHVAVIPIKMSEAWLLPFESEIRQASGNPKSKIALELPNVKQTETVNAKQILFSAIKTASELKGRKLEKFDLLESRQRVAGLIDDFAILRNFPTFASFEVELLKAVREFSNENQI